MNDFENRISDVDKLKEEIDKKRPLSERQSKMLREHYRIGFTYSSNALEGNTLTEVETKVVLEDGLTIGGKSLRDHQEVQGHSKAYDFLYDLVTNDGFTEENILQLHRFFYEKVDPVQAGKYRTEQVIITGSTVELPQSKDIPALIKKFVGELPKINERHHPVEFAAITHNKFVTIHPFIDGNGRVGRLLMNLILMQRGYVITIVPPIYRPQYLNCAYQGNKNNHRLFINFLSCMVYESEREYINLLTNLSGDKE